MTVGVPAVAIVNTFVIIMTTRRVAVVMAMVANRRAAVVMAMVANRRAAVVMVMVATRRAAVVMVLVTTRRAVRTQCGGIFTQWSMRLPRSNLFVGIVKIRLTKESLGHKIFNGFSSIGRFDFKHRFDKLFIIYE